MIHPDLSGAIYAVVIRALPRSFRLRNREELIEHFQWLSDQSPGITGFFRLWRLVLADTISVALALRRDSIRKRQLRPKTGVRAGSWAVAGAGFLCILFGVFILPERSVETHVLVLSSEGLEPTGALAPPSGSWLEAYEGTKVQLQIHAMATNGEVFEALELLNEAGVKRVTVDSKGWGGNFDGTGWGGS